MKKCEISFSDKHIYFHLGKKIVGKKHVSALSHIFGIDAMDCGIERIGFPEKQISACLLVFDDQYWVLPWYWSVHLRSNPSYREQLANVMFAEKELWFDTYWGPLDRWRFRTLGALPSTHIMVPQVIPFKKQTKVELLTLLDELQSTS